MQKQVAALSVFLFSVSLAHADVVFLKNGDKVNGEILEKTDTALKVKSAVLGELSINNESIESVLTEAEVQAKAQAEATAAAEAIEDAKMKAVAAVKQEMAAQAPAPAVQPEAAPAKVKYWEHKFAAGFSTTNGNTKTTAGNLALDSHYKKEKMEWSIKSTLNYASDKGKMTTQKFFSKAENDYRFEGSNWFNTRSVEVNHDKYAFVDYRVLPAVGLGYWFWEGDDSKSKLDVGAGYEYTKYNSGAKSTGNATIIPHYYLDKVLVAKLKFSEDVTIYPSLDSLQDYRLRSETSLVNPMTDTLSWKLSFVDEYNSSPKSNAKKNDTTLMSSLEYSF